MQGLRTDKKRKAVLVKRKRTLLRRRNCQKLELRVKDNNGNCSTYLIPVQKVTTKRSFYSKRMYKIQNSSNTSDTWNIVGRDTKIFIPEMLVDKKISLRKGNMSVEGIVLSVKPLGKMPEGKPVSTPPPPLNGGSSS